MNVDIISVISSADWRETAGYVASAIVVLGIAIESVDLIAHIWSGNLRDKRWEFSGFLIVIFGLAVEILTQVQSNNRTGLVIGALNDEAATALKEASQAQLALEKLKTPRSLTDDQLSSVIEALEPFAGQEFAITTYWDMKEPLAFANRLYEPLTRARWKYIKPDRATFLLGGIEGVQIWIHPDADPLTKQAREALLAALKGADIAVEQKEQNPSNPKTNLIELNVGTKP